MCKGIPKKVGAVRLSKARNQCIRLRKEKIDKMKKKPEIPAKTVKGSVVEVSGTEVLRLAAMVNPAVKSP